MTSTIVGMFDDGSRARAAANELSSLGASCSNITVTQGDSQNGYMAYQGSGDAEGREVGGGISGFFKRLFGSDIEDDDSGLYSEAVRRGNSVVTADVDENDVDAAAQVLQRNGASDVDRIAERYRSTGYSRFDESAPIYTPEQSRTDWDAVRSQEDVAVPVVEEELQVGKRTVRRGGVRIHTRVTERPVDEVVTLREERVRVERRPASRQATPQDLDVMPNGTFEVTENAEEVVVAKQARVVEEVIVSKDLNEREQHVRDTVRRTDVDVEEMDSADQPRRVRRGKGDGTAL